MAKMQKLKLLLVDDHPFVIEGLRASLQRVGRFEIVGEALNGEEAISKTRELQPDVVILDITMPGMNGIDVARMIRTTWPDIRVLMLTMHDKREFVCEAIRTGAHGYVKKNGSPAQLVEAIDCVVRAETYYEPGMRDAFVQQFVVGNSRSIRDLPPRQGQVLDMIAQGLSNKIIASDLGLSVRTVEKYRELLMRRLGAHNVVELVQYAYRYRELRQSE
jgi:two-component system, NarL family, nitrate/nitrite response regulator NarL